MSTSGVTEGSISLSRRDLLKAIGVASLGFGLPMIVNGGRESMAAAAVDEYSADILVIGSGFAGTFAALKAREAGLKVTMVDKGSVGHSGLSPWASDCRPFRKGTDNREEWIQNISTYTEFVNDHKWLEIFMDECMGIYEELNAWGCDKKHPYERADVFRGKLDKAGVTVVERVMITSLLQQDDGRVGGAVGFTYDDTDTKCKAQVFRANVVILCTGAGAYKSPGFPNWGQTFDGDAMAYAAGAYITGKEFNDMHWTYSTHPAASYANWSWAQKVKGFLVMKGAPPRSGPGGLTLKQTLEAYVNGVNRETATEYDRPPEQRAEGTPAADKLDYIRGYPVGGSTAGMGVHKGEGIFCSDYTCAADGVPGLYAAGDALGSMMTGSVYPARGLSAFFSAIQGRRAAKFAVQYVKKSGPAKISKTAISKATKQLWAPRERKWGYSPRWVTQVLQNLMTPYFILYVKEARRLEGALASLEHLRNHCVPALVAVNGHDLRLAHETAHMLLNAEMKLRAGLFRTESRGTHYREEYPARIDKEWLVWVKIHKENNKMVLSKHPIPKEWRPPAELSYRERYPRVFPGEDEYIKKMGIS